MIRMENKDMERAGMKKVHHGGTARQGNPGVLTPPVKPITARNPAPEDGSQQEMFVQIHKSIYIMRRKGHLTA